MSRGKAPGNHWTGGWVGSRTGPDEVMKRKKIPDPAGNQTSIIQLAA